MTAPARIPVDDDPLDVIAMTIARILARQHHADSLAATPEPINAHRDLRPLQQPAAER
ncbi:hypothetical protein [Croceicoccus naphthovorans]|uniref:hypothetical protein n=1 Tax=Croceicoccus naphthovorans TaxID=1348774 RepID=UPI000ABACD8C|nr:hypothetical protein [Croceicoccus naphthovorans]MBB3991289.1 hypothetical protein [Croceicoccus naphthovorans]